MSDDVNAMKAHLHLYIGLRVQVKANLRKCKDIQLAISPAQHIHGCAICRIEMN